MKLTLLPSAKLGRDQACHCPKTRGHDPAKRTKLTGTLENVPFRSKHVPGPHFALQLADKCKYIKIKLLAAAKLVHVQASQCPTTGGHDPTKRTKPMGTLGDASFRSKHIPGPHFALK